MGMWEDGIYHVLAANGSCPTIAGTGGVTQSTGCGQIQLTTAWSASAAFEHLWTPALRTSIYGSYVNVSHNDTAKLLICNAGGGVFTAGLPFQTGCDPDWSAWNIGTRTQWEPVKGFIMGVDVLYNKLNSSSPNFLNNAGLTGAGGIPTTATANANCAAGNAAALASNPPCYRATDMDAWIGTFRVQRDFLP
jgi:hypothetical protein